MIILQKLGSLITNSMILFFYDLFHIFPRFHIIKKCIDTLKYIQIKKDHTSASKNIIKKINILLDMII